MSKDKVLPGQTFTEKEIAAIEKEQQKKSPNNVYPPSISPEMEGEEYNPAPQVNSDKNFRQIAEKAGHQELGREDLSKVSLPVPERHDPGLQHEAVDTMASEAIRERDAGKAKERRRAALAFLETYKPETEEQRQKRERREARGRLFAALGDGISAISNLFTARAGAPSVYDHNRGMTAAYDARMERLRQERKAREREYWNAYAILGRANMNEYYKALNEAKMNNLKSQIDARDKKSENDKALTNARIRRLEALQSTDKARHAYWNTMVEKLEAGRPYWEAEAAAKVSELQERAKYTQAKTVTEKGKPAVQASQVEKNQKLGNAAVIRANHSGSKNGNENQKQSRSGSRGSGGGSGKFSGFSIKKK